jgi:hypothetical protein|uniref:cDNA clone:J013004F22, full insert sequence n=1 Tax=Oryza sativa subsp. japonica TaxID=39947 RepID=B7EP17_ORYSJ|nr:unnamed protein product [Oryza sativa Japonica Group]BAG94240.1 unnamed protein product [Oryza sativa Japonica Group]
MRPFNQNLPKAMRRVGIQARDVKVSRGEAPYGEDYGTRTARGEGSRGYSAKPVASWAKDVGRRVYAEGRRFRQSKLAPARAEEAFSGPSSLGAIGPTIARRPIRGS